MAQQAGMSTEAFEDFYFRVCTLDYRRMAPGMKALGDLMRRTDRVHIKGPGTDLRFSIKGIGAEECGGLQQHPRRRGLLLPGQGKRRGRHPVQRPHGLPGHVLRQHPPRLQAGARSSRPRPTTPSA